MVFPGIGRQAWVSGSLGSGTGRTTDWSTYDATEDTAWQQWVDDSSSALSSSYQATNTERNAAYHSREQGYMVVTNGSQEFLARIDIDTLDASNAKWTLTGAYDMERGELVKLGNKMMITSLQNNGSVVLVEVTPSTITSSGVLTEALTTAASSSERSFGLLYSAQVPDTLASNSNTAQTETIFLIGGRQAGQIYLTNDSVGYQYDVPSFRMHFSTDWSRDIANTPSDSLLNRNRELLSRGSGDMNLSHISEMQTGSGGSWWTYFVPDYSTGNYIHRPQNAWLPTTLFHPTTLGTRDGSNGASSDKTFLNHAGSSYTGRMRQTVRPFFVKQSSDYIAALKSAFGSSYNYMAITNYNEAQHQYISWRGLRGGSGDRLIIGWTVECFKIQQQGGVQNEASPQYNTTNNNVDLGSYEDVSSSHGSLDTTGDAIYPNQSAQPRVANNDRVQFRSAGDRTSTQLGEDLIQAIQVDNIFVGMYPDTTGTKGGNLYLSACGFTAEPLYDIFEGYALNFINADDISSTEVHASNSIAVSTVNGTDSTSTAFDPDTATIFNLHGSNFAVVWRKSTTAYISVFSVAGSSSTPPTVTRLVDALNLGTVPEGNISGIKFGNGVALVTCGNYYKFIKVPV